MVVSPFLHIFSLLANNNKGDYMQKFRISDMGADAVVIGSIIFGISVNLFIVSCDLIPGGATGVGIILNHITGISVGLGIILVNLPLFLLSIRFLGAQFLIKTLLATLLSSISVDIFSFLPTVTNDRILACIFGGLSSGVGLAIIFQRGIMTGGSDLLSHLIRQLYPRWPLGKLLLIVDGAIIVVGSVIYHDLAGMLYSLILAFVTSLSIDYILARTEKGTVCFIIANESRKIEVEILKNLGRGATLLQGIGCYSGETRNVILCAVYSHELAKLRKIVYKVDKTAFFIAANTAEISGYGFLTDR